MQELRMHQIFRLYLILVALGLFVTEVRGEDQIVILTHNNIDITTGQSTYEQLDDGAKSFLLNRAKKALELFETKIVPKLPSESLDAFQDKKIEIYISNSEGATDGLFVPTWTGFRLEINRGQLSSNGLLSLLAHEFFHAVHYYLNPGEETWVREGLAQVFEYIVSGELNGGNFRAILEKPYSSVVQSSFDINQVAKEKYGHTMLYFYYLYQHCGTDDLFWKVTKGIPDKVYRGAKLIDEILKSLKLSKEECSSFDESLRSFEISRFHNKVDYSEGTGNDRYFLFSTKALGVSSVDYSNSEIQQIFKELPLTIPLRLTIPQYMENNFHCKKCDFYFIEKKFPFRVFNTKPSMPGFYEILIFKN